MRKPRARRSLLINLPFFFAKIMEHNRRSQVGHTLGMKISIGNGKYLGLVYFIGRSKFDIFAYLKDRFGKRSFYQKGARRIS